MESAVGQNEIGCIRECQVLKGDGLDGRKHRNACAYRSSEMGSQWVPLSETHAIDRKRSR